MDRFKNAFRMKIIPKVMHSGCAATYRAALKRESKVRLRTPSEKQIYQF